MCTRHICVGLLCWSFLWSGRVAEGLSLQVHGSDGQVADVTFSWGDDIPQLAMAAADAMKIDSGGGCTDRACVARLLEVTMRGRLANEISGNSVSSRGVIDKTHAVYTPKLPAHAAQQAAEDASRAATLARRAALAPDHRPQTARGTTSATGKFASVPCVPPYCTFECAAPRLKPQHLDEFESWASAKTIGDAANNPSFNGRLSSSTNSTASTRLHTLKRLIGSDASLLGTSGWPLPARSCPLSQTKNAQSTSSDDSASSNTMAVIRPIWIAIPAERVVDCVPRKWAAFENFATAKSQSNTRAAESAAHTHSNPYAYAFKGSAEDEFEYHRRYRGALFGATRKKAGWDCMRHSEVLAAGSFPWFEDFVWKEEGFNSSHGADDVDWVLQNVTSSSSLDESDDDTFFPPANVLAHLPVRFLRRYQHFLVRSGSVYRPRTTFCDYSVSQGSALGSEASWKVNYTRFDHVLHLQISGLLLGYTQRRLTTVALAEYLLTSSGNGHLLEANSNGRVLMLSGFGHADYVRDMTLHGLRTLLGRRFVDYIRPKLLYRLREYDAPVTSNTEVPNGDTSGSSAFAAANSPKDADAAATPLAAVESSARADLYGRGFTYAHRLAFEYDDYDPAAADEFESQTGCNCRCSDGKGHDCSVDGSDIWEGLFDGGGNKEEELGCCRSDGMSLDRSIDTLKAAIARLEFEVVVFGSVHRGRPLWDEVLAAGYTRDRVLLIDGEDENVLWHSSHAELLQHGQLYVREMPKGCPGM